MRKAFFLAILFLAISGITAPSVRSEGVKKEHLKARVRDAECVVTGTVVAITIFPNDAATEHSADWRYATVRVESYLKGGGDAELVVKFPASVDVVWHAYPKFFLGQNGIWILRRDENEPQLLTAYDASDFQPLANEKLLLRALQEVGRPSSKRSFCSSVWYVIQYPFRQIGRVLKQR